MYSDEVLRNLAGNNPPDGSDNAKKMVGSAQGMMGVAGAVSSIASNVLSGMFSRSQQERAHKLAIAQSVANAGIQESLWKTQLREGAARSVAGLKAAGLNPAMAQGGNLGTPPLSSSPGSPVHANPVQIKDPVETMMQAKHLENETKIADAQAGLLKSQTNDQDWHNTPGYRDRVIRGMDQQINESVSREEANWSQVDLNDQKLNESVQQEALLLKQCGLVDSEIAKNAAEYTRTFFQCAEILQNMKESEARIAAHKASANCQNALAGLYRAAKKGQEITNEMLAHEEENLRRTMQARESVMVPAVDENGNPTGHYRSYWGHQAAVEANATQMANIMTQYELNMLKSLPPEERQKYLMDRDIAGLSIQAFGAVGSFMGGAASMMNAGKPPKQTTFNFGFPGHQE